MAAAHVPPIWPSDWLRGVLELSVLRILSDGPTYGYAISTSLGDAGFGGVKGGTLYPLLARLEESGFVDVDWRAGDGGPGRKYYALTGAGRARHLEQTRLWLEFTTLTSDFLSPRVAAVPTEGH
jgi:PadR family transcriptional regulator